MFLDDLLAAERALVARVTGRPDGLAPPGRAHGPRHYRTPSGENQVGSPVGKYWGQNYRQPVIATSQPGAYKRYELLAAPVSATSNNTIFAVPPGTIWRIVSLKCVVITDATVGNRGVALCFMPSGGVLTNNTLAFVTQSGLLQPPSSGFHHSWMAGGDQGNPSVMPSYGLGALPERFIVYENMRFQIFVNPQTPGDTVQAIETYVEEWVTYTR